MHNTLMLIECARRRAQSIEIHVGHLYCLASWFTYCTFMDTIRDRGSDLYVGIDMVIHYCRMGGNRQRKGITYTKLKLYFTDVAVEAADIVLVKVSVVPV